MNKSFKLASTSTRPNGRVLGGVLSGIANYTEMDVAIIRILFTISVFFFGFGLGFYFLVWIVGALTVGYDEG